MPNIKFTPIPTADAQKWWDGGNDAYEQPLEHRISDGGAPCRHCLKKHSRRQARFTRRLQAFCDNWPFHRNRTDFFMWRAMHPVCWRRQSIATSCG